MELDETKKFSSIDYMVFGMMLVISSAIGIFYAWKDRKNKSNTDFLTSNRGLHWFPVAMSLMASFQSSVTILGYPAEMYLRGTQFWFVIISACVAAVAAAEIFLPVYYKLRFTSVNRYLKLRYNSENVRLASSIAFLLGTVPYMGVVLYGPSLALSSVTNLSVSSSILIIGLICTFYTSIGGIKAVVWTDTLQVFLMFGGLIAVMARGFSLVGGIEEAFRIANREGRIQFFNVEFNPYATNNLWNAVFGMGIMWCGNYCTTQTEVQRYCNVQTKRKAKLAIYTNLVGVIAIISCACLCGVAIFAYYDHCDPLKRNLIQRSDQLMPYFVMDTLSEYRGVPGLFVACVFSASLSTLSSGFNALAAVTWDDFLRHTNIVKMSDSKIKTLSKIIAASYGLLTIAMAFLVGQIGSVLQAAISLSGALVGPLFGTYLLGIICTFANSTGVLIGLFCAEAFSLWILIGSLVHPAKPYQLATYTDRCHMSSNFSSSTIDIATSTMLPEMNMNPNTSSTSESFPLSLYHIAFLLVPISGFVISFTVGLIASLLTGGLKRVKEVDPVYLNRIVFKIWPKSWLPLENNDSEMQVKKKYTDNNGKASSNEYQVNHKEISLGNGNYENTINGKYTVTEDITHC